MSADESGRHAGTRRNQIWFRLRTHGRSYRTRRPLPCQSVCSFDSDQSSRPMAGSATRKSPSSVRRRRTTECPMPGIQPHSCSNRGSLTPRGSRTAARTGQSSAAISRSSRESTISTCRSFRAVEAERGSAVVIGQAEGDHVALARGDSGGGEERGGGGRAACGPGGLHRHRPFPLVLTGGGRPQGDRQNRPQNKRQRRSRQSERQDRPPPPRSARQTRGPARRETSRDGREIRVDDGRRAGDDPSPEELAGEVKQEEDRRHDRQGQEQHHLLPAVGREETRRDEPRPGRGESHNGHGEPDISHVWRLYLLGGLGQVAEQVELAVEIPLEFAPEAGERE